MERFTSFSLEMEELRAEMPDGYYVRKLQSVSRGEAVWVTRNFTGLAGRVIDFYADKQHVGTVDIDYTHDLYASLMVATAMIPDSVEGNYYLSEQPVPLGEAMRLIEQHYQRSRTRG